MFARTDRLLLRPGFAEDATDLANAIGEEAVVRNLARAPWPYRAEDARMFLSLERAPLMPDFVILLRTGATPRLIGGVGFAAGEAGAVEFGYWIARSHWGLGFASEAGRAALDIGRAIGLTRIEAAHFVDNPASGAVLRKLGFRRTGRIVPRHSVARGGTVAAVEHRLDEAEGDLPAMSGKRCPIAPEDDVRQQIRLMAA